MAKRQDGITARLLLTRMGNHQAEVLSDILSDLDEASATQADIDLSIEKALRNHTIALVVLMLAMHAITIGIVFAIR